MVISTAEITATIGSFLWPFFRIAAMLMAAPVTGARYFPVRVRILTAAIIAAVLAPHLADVPAFDPFSPLTLLVTLQQIIVGVAMGFAFQLVFATVILGGQIVALQMGLGFASMVDPQNGLQVPMVSQIYLLAATLIFLAFDGHLLMIEVLAESFRAMPVGLEGLDRDAFRLLAEWGSHMFAGAVLISAPAVAALLVVNISFGLMTRASPQLNIFAVGFPVTMTIGFGIMMMAMPSFMPQTGHLVQDVMTLVRDMVGVGS